MSFETLLEQIILQNQFVLYVRNKLSIFKNIFRGLNNLNSLHKMQIDRK